MNTLGAGNLDCTNYLVPLESLKCWLGGAPAGHLVQSPPHSWTPARTRSGKRSLGLSKS